MCPEGLRKPAVNQLVGISMEIILSHEQKSEVFTFWTTVLGGSNTHGRISHVSYYVGNILVLLKIFVVSFGIVMCSLQGSVAELCEPEVVYTCVFNFVHNFILGGFASNLWDQFYCITLGLTLWLNFSILIICIVLFVLCARLTLWLFILSAALSDSICSPILYHLRTYLKGNQVITMLRILLSRNQRAFSSIHLLPVFLHFNCMGWD